MLRQKIHRSTRQETHRPIREGVPGELHPETQPSAPQAFVAETALVCWNQDIGTLYKVPDHEHALQAHSRVNQTSHRVHPVQHLITALPDQREGPNDFRERPHRVRPPQSRPPE